eukprot:gene16395-biopygen5497
MLQLHALIALSWLMQSILVKQSLVSHSKHSSRDISRHRGRCARAPPRVMRGVQRAGAVRRLRVRRAAAVHGDRRGQLARRGDGAGGDAVAGAGPRRHRRPRRRRG